MLSDGINAFSPENQPVEFWKASPGIYRNVLRSYGVTNYVDMLGRNDAPGVWYPDVFVYQFTDIKYTGRTDTGTDGMK